MASKSQLTRNELTRARTERAPAAEPTLGERTRGLVGSIASRRVPSGRSANEVLRHWMPDRRD